MRNKCGNKSIGNRNKKRGSPSIPWCTYPIELPKHCKLLPVSKNTKPKVKKSKRPLMGPSRIQVPVHINSFPWYPQDLGSEALNDDQIAESSIVVIEDRKNILSLSKR